MAPLTRPAPLRRPAPARRPRPVRAPRTQAAPLPRGAALLDAILHGRIWIAIVFALLAGIVFFNVDLLQMNREIARTAERAAAVKRENARLRSDLARLGSSERIQNVAAERGLVLPAPGEVRYLRSRPQVDARNAAKRLETRQAATAQTTTPPTTP
jgi:cell division protein FtsL